MNVDSLGGIVVVVNEIRIFMIQSNLIIEKNLLTMTIYIFLNQIIARDQSILILSQPINRSGNLQHFFHFP